MIGRIFINRWKTLLLVMFISCGVVLSTWKIQSYNYRPYIHETLYLPSGTFLKEMSTGYRNLSADMVWLNAVQYYGDYRLDSHDLSYFKGLIDIVTTLDPQFIFAYQFGAIVLSQDMGRWEESVNILKKGMVENPTSWELPFEIGFLTFLSRKNLDLAARYFELASKLPDCPPVAKRFSAYVYSKAGHRENSIRMWEEMKETTTDPYLREMADKYIEDLRSSSKAGEKNDTHI